MIVIEVGVEEERNGERGGRGAGPMSYMFSCSDENNRAKAIGMRLRRLRGEMK